MQKLRIAVLMGGPSSEYDVSLASGRMVCENLNSGRYDIIPVHIDRGGEWAVSFEDLLGNIDLVFLALHGEFGEDGTMQRFLDDVGLPYTGSASHASALGMNKIASSKLFRAYGLDVPDWDEVTRHGDWAYFRTPFGYPAVVKPADRGSSLGVGIARSEFDLRESLCKVFEISRNAMIQKYVSGREITCAVIEDERGELPLPPTEIIPKNSHLFDFDSKYQPGASREITPAPITRRETEEVQRIAVAAHRIIGASGVSRTDMIISNDGRIYVLETNTLPGLTPTSLLPQAANNIGLSNSALLDKIIASAIRRYSNNS